MTGFGSVPDELQRTAGRIAETVDHVADVVWRGPGGDYGHGGVQAAWSRFMQDVEDQVRSLREKAGEHGDGLRDAARRYLEQEQEGLDVFSGLQDAVEQQPQAAPVGGGAVGRGAVGRGAVGGGGGPLGGASGIASVLDGGR